MEKPKEIYKSIESKIKEINAEIKLHQNINNEVAKNLYNSSNQIKDTLEGLQSEINNLEDNSEWEHYTISFIGETNAGKSTIIEALRIEYNEEEKRDNYDRNFTLLAEENSLCEKLKQQEKQFDSEKHTIDNNKVNELNTYLLKAEEIKKGFLFKIRKFVQKKYEPYSSEILTLRKDIEINLNRKFDDLEWVIQDRMRLDEIKSQIKYDGAIIGDGRLDFTQKNKVFFIRINNELVKIIDVPGIEGNEQKYEEEIKNAVSKSHCVFYVTSSTKTLESGTLSKVKKYIKDQADVFAIVNLRLNSYKEEYYSLSFEEIYKNKLEAIGSISSQLKEELKGNFIDIVSINGHWGFLSLSKYLAKEGEKQKLSSDKSKLMNVFQDESIIYAKSNFKNLANVIFETISQKESKIYRTNILKINTLVDKLMEDLQENLNKNLSSDILKDIKEQADNSKNEVNSTYKDFLRDMDSIRIRLLNDFKRKSYEAIDSFVQDNKIDKNVYNVGIKRILNEQGNLLQENIESNLKVSNEKVNKQIEKSLKKFLDRLDILSKMNNISFTNPNLSLSFDFFKSDLLKLGEALLSVGGLAWAGFTLGSIFPVIGNIVGAIIGGALGLGIELFKNFFTSVTSRKSKILIKVSEQLEEKTKELDKQLQKEFANISEGIKKKSIDNSLALIDELVERYQLRRNKITEVIKELENIKINN